MYRRPLGESVWEQVYHAGGVERLTCEFFEARLSRSVGPLACPREQLELLFQYRETSAAATVRS